MSVKYKLTYFNAEGLAETARWIFAVAGVNYEDVRLESDEKWKTEVKSKTPFGQLPVLSVDGAEISQSKAIGRFLARRFGLAGNSPIEEARADMVVDCAEDMRLPLVPIFYGTDEIAKNAACEKYQDEQLPSFLKRFEKLLSKNNGGHGYFVGDSITWADLYFTTNFTIMRNICNTYSIEMKLENYPKVSALLDRVLNHPAIVDWIKRRPAGYFANNNNNNESKR